ncbi:Zn-ribbon domain-containing OB-fold protein [Pseudofrankia asymbiotica]|uniref:DUF35 domain-containing protein n=1 Tax=Pseudofrankia asymbiotica TaxID=1834516 RepID=A0A1V2I104_9ACTN|nr:OB-fold domain-containing protein [Pseudofrankia asymbiotica]ONH21861.1 hypothetical protein BL253_37555 [Pseudofrankia asymbiotica]
MDLRPFFQVDDGRVRLLGTRCASCGTAAFPTIRVCPACGGRDHLPAGLPARGRVVSSARVSTPPAGFGEPVTVAVVTLDDGPSLFALLSADPAEPAQLAAGTPVEAVPGPVRGGAAGFVFRTAREDRAAA